MHDGTHCHSLTDTIIIILLSHFCLFRAMTYYVSNVIDLLSDSLCLFFL